MSGLRERRLRCAACGGDSWLRDDAGHAVCPTCAPEGCRGPVPVEIVAPEGVLALVRPAGPEAVREERLKQLQRWARRETLLHDLDELADVLEGRTA